MPPPESSRAARSSAISILGWDRDAAVICQSPVIRRRSGVRKFEVDLRRGSYRLAPSPVKIAAVVFLSKEQIGGRPLLEPLSNSSLLVKLRAEQAYAANQPEWSAFSKSVTKLEAFELRRGRHPLEAVESPEGLLESTR